MNINDLFKEISEETYQQKVIIDGDYFPIGFNTSINKNKNNNNTCILNIEQEDKFYKKLEEYINIELEENRKRFVISSNNKEKELYKLFIICLFSNATKSDFNKPIEFIDKYISFLKDKTFNNYKIKFNVEDYFKDSILEVENIKQDIRMETPNMMSFKLINKDTKEEYLLPGVYYGIDNDKCYIYSILNKNDDRKSSKYKKYINRRLYKINEGLIEEDKDIYDVSMSSVLSLFVFIRLLKLKDINKIICISELPIRSLSRKININNCNDIERKNILIERDILIDNNSKYKLINTFKRLSKQLSSFDVEFDNNDLIIGIFNNNVDYSNNKLLDGVKDIIKSK